MMKAIFGSEIYVDTLDMRFVFVVSKFNSNTQRAVHPCVDGEIKY